MRRKGITGVAVLLAALMAVPLVSGIAAGGAVPEAKIIAPDTIEIENGGTAVIRGVLIKGSAKDLTMKLTTKSETKLVTGTVLSVTTHGNVIAAEVVFKGLAEKKGQSSVTGDVGIIMTATSKKKKETYTATDSIRVTVLLGSKEVK